MSVQETFDTYLPRIEDALREALAMPHPSLQPFYGMMHYHMGWVDESFQLTTASTGKRLRPLFCLLACHSAGGDPEQALPAAAAVEILHNFSLVHDDIEDNDATRRHRPTVWAIWGQPQAINVGDGMFSLAYLTLSRLSATGCPAQLVLQAMQAFQAAALTLTEGQYLDMSFEERFDIDKDDYLWMIHNKTASLLATSTQLGAILAGADNTTVTAYREFGAAVGMTFQICDDILGIWGDQTLTGKPSASDIRRKKKSLPLVYTLERLRQTRDEGRLYHLREIYAQPMIVDDEVEDVLRVLDAVDARRYCEELAMHYQEQGMAHLRTAGEASATDQEALDALRELALSLIDRQC